MARGLGAANGLELHYIEKLADGFTWRFLKKSDLPIILIIHVLLESM